LENPTQQVVVGLGFAYPTQGPVVVEQGFARPTGQVVEEQERGYSTQRVAAGLGFAYPTQGPVVEQELVPSQEFVVGEQQIVLPTQGPVVVEHPIH
jgi:hypothetical protein